MLRLPRKSRRTKSLVACRRVCGCCVVTDTLAASENVALSPQCGTYPSLLLPRQDAATKKFANAHPRATSLFFEFASAHMMAQPGCELARGLVAFGRLGAMFGSMFRSVVRGAQRVGSAVRHAPSVGQRAAVAGGVAAAAAAVALGGSAGVAHLGEFESCDAIGDGLKGEFWKARVRVVSVGRALCLAQRVTFV